MVPQDETPIPEDVDYVDCPYCLAAAQAEPTGFYRPERVTDPARVKTWPDLVTKTEHKHYVDRGGILAYYELPQFTVCSLGHHEHKQGDIARTRCGLVVQLGWKCANRAVYGYADAKAYRKQVEEHFDRLQRIRGIPIDCFKELQNIVPELKRWVHWRDAKRSTAFGLEMTRRAVSSDPKACEVSYRSREFRQVNRNDPMQMKTQETVETVKLKGLDFWTANFDVHRAERVLDQAATLVQDSKIFDVDDNEIAAALDRRAGSLMASMRSVRNAVELCRLFNADENLRLANLAVGPGNTDNQTRTP